MVRRTTGRPARAAPGPRAGAGLPRGRAQALPAGAGYTTGNSGPRKRLAVLETEAPERRRSEAPEIPEHRIVAHEAGREGPAPRGFRDVAGRAVEGEEAECDRVPRLHLPAREIEVAAPGGDVRDPLAPVVREEVGAVEPHRPEGAPPAVRPAHVFDGGLTRDRVEGDPEAHGLVPCHAVVGLVVVPGSLHRRARFLDEDVLVKEAGMGGPHQGRRDRARRALEHEPPELLDPVPVAVVLKERRAPVGGADGALEGARVGHHRRHPGPEGLHPIVECTAEHRRPARPELVDDTGRDPSGTRFSARRGPVVTG